MRETVCKCDTGFRASIRGNRGLSPFLDPEAREQLLWPVLSERRAVLMPEGDEVLLLDGRKVRARCCEYIGDQYADGTRFWLGSDNDLLRYCWQQPGVGEWDVRMETAVG
jgi:hypothetical protein